MLFLELRSISNEKFYVRPSYRELKNKPIADTDTDIIKLVDEELLIDENETEQITDIWTGEITDTTKTGDSRQSHRTTSIQIFDSVDTKKKGCIPRIIYKKKRKSNQIQHNLLFNG